MRVSLNDFARTGALGPVLAGFTPTQREAVFGPPEATGGTSRRRRQPTIWKYGDIEFHFLWPDGTLCLIHLDRFSGEAGCPVGWGGLEIDPWIIREGLPRDCFIAALEAEGIQYIIRHEPQFNHDVLLLPSGVHGSFVLEAQEYSPPVGLAALSRRMA